MKVNGNSQIITLNGVSIPVKAVLKRLGYPAESEPRDKHVRRLLQEELDHARNLLDPKGVFRIMRVESKTENTISFLDFSFVIRSSQVARMLKDADPVIGIMVTIGPALEDEVKRLIDKGDAARGFILDAIGSETADECANVLHRKILRELARERGFRITPRFSPGYGNWPLTVQKELLQVCGGDLIGISVNSSSLMIPRKSVSAILGWIQDRRKSGGSS